MKRPIARRLLEKAAGVLFAEYSYYRIFRLSAPQAPGQPAETKAIPVNAAELEQSTNELMREQAWCCGEEALVYAHRHDDDIAAVCCYWYGERYKTRNFWPLQKGEAKLVQVITEPALRGRGIAPTLISDSAQDMFRRGFKTLYARIWHSNSPSLRAFEKVGFTEIARVLTARPSGFSKLFRIVRRLHKSTPDD